MSRLPSVYLLDVTPPAAQRNETEGEFWRRKALERAQSIAQLRAELVALAERLNAVLEDVDE